MKVIVKETFPPATVEWKGKKYLPGEEIPDLPEKEAKRLLKAGKVEVLTAGKQKTKDAATPEEILEAAKKAIEAGETTGNGKPKVEALEEILGVNVSAVERDQAWDQLKDAASSTT